MFYFSGDGEEILGWASAQVVCICSINPQKVHMLDTATKTSAYQISMAVNSTSLSPSRGERGLVVFSTNPKILVCDLKLSDDSSIDCKLSLKRSTSFTSLL